MASALAGMEDPIQSEWFWERCYEREDWRERKENAQNDFGKMCLLCQLSRACVQNSSQAFATVLNFQTSTILFQTEI